MSTVQQVFAPIAEIANSHDEVISTQSATAFKQFPDAVPADVLGLFTKRAAVPLVWAGYIMSQSDLTFSEVKPYLDGISQFYSELTIHTDKTQMLAELILADSKVTEPVAVLDAKLASIASALKAIKDGTITKDSKRVAELRLEIMDLLPILSISEPVLQNA